MCDKSAKFKNNSPKETKEKNSPKVQLKLLMLQHINLVPQGFSRYGARAEEDTGKIR